MTPLEAARRHLTKAQEFLAEANSALASGRANVALPPKFGRGSLLTQRALVLTAASAEPWVAKQYRKR